MVTNVFSSILSPGVNLVESDIGYRVNGLASHVTTYMIGSGALGAFSTPTLVTSLTDFTTKFGASSSTAAVRMFFRNVQTSANSTTPGIFYFIRTQIAPRWTVTVNSAAAGAYTVTINGTAVTYTAPASPTPTIASVRTAVIDAINTAPVVGVAVQAVAGTVAAEIFVTSRNPAVTPTVVASTANLTATSSTPTTPTALDYVYALDNAFDLDDNWNQGFIIAPEVFQTLATATDRLAVGNAMRALAIALDSVTLIDPHTSTNTVALLQTDSAQYTTAKGHLAYFAPYLIDLENTSVPPSPAVAAAAAIKYATEGFQEPIGGKRYPIQAGVRDVVVRFTNSDQDISNPIGCNLIRNFTNRGIVIWGMRTRSADSLYTFLHTRVIMNVLNGTLRRSFDEFPFSSIDGRGVLLHRIEETAISVCRRLYRGGALFGETEDAAFAVECSFNNNDEDDLELGNVLLAVYAAPVPGLEKLLVASYRVPIGQVQTSAERGLFVANS